MNLPNNIDYDGPSAWDILLLRLFKDESGPLYWQKCGACCVMPSMGSWSGHTSGSADGRPVIEGCGFDKANNVQCQQGTRKWLDSDKRRRLYGFTWTSNNTRGPEVEEVCDHQRSTDIWFQRSVRWLSQPPPDIRPAPPKSDERYMPFTHPDGVEHEGMPPEEAFGPEGSWGPDLRGETRKRRARELMRLYELREYTALQDYDASWYDCLLPAPFMTTNKDCFKGPAALRGYEMPYCATVDNLFRQSMYHGRTGRFSADDKGVHGSLADKDMWQFADDAPSVEASMAVATRAGGDSKKEKPAEEPPEKSRRL